ncbi:MAG: Maf family protein [Methylohalobius sp. ZOD2]|nr:septum formation inhibitor Maf [Methylothermaceae bacterium]
MSTYQLILASASPRRRELLDQIGLKFQIRPADIDETPRPDEPPQDYVTRLAREKAQAARAETREPLPILGADTAVILDGEMLGKPRHETEGLNHLRRISGKRHEVLSAVCLNLTDPPRILEALNKSRVHFRQLTEDEIIAYWRSGEPRDKAGAYAIQGRGAIFVERLEGSFSGVMGLPLYETAGLLRKAGIQVL